MCWDTDCLHCRSYGPIRVFFRAFCSWQSEGIFGQSLSADPPIQALRGLPCLGSFSVVPCVRHIEGSPWLGPYSVDERVRQLKGHPVWVLLGRSACQAFDGPASIVQLPMLACGERENMVIVPPTMCDSAVWPCFHGCPASLHRHFPPQSRPSYPLDLSLCSQQQPSS